MTTTLTLYKTRILKERNMAIDSLEDYLATCTSLVTQSFQYVKIAPSISVKVAAPQAWAGERNATYNYCKISATDENTNYYFIDNMEWIAEDTIKLNLSIDVLNTWETTLTGGALGTKTQVIREHRNRYAYHNRTYVENIDRVSEGNNFPLVRTLQETITQSPSVDWYNVFVANGTSESEPIMRLTLPSEGMTAVTKNYTGTAFINLQTKLATFAEDEETFYFIGNENNQANAGYLCSSPDQPRENKIEFVTDMYRTGTDENGKAVKCLAISITFHLNESDLTMYIDGYTYWYYDDLTFYKKEVLKFVNNTSSYTFTTPGITTHFIGFTYSGILHYAPASKISATALTDMLNLPKWTDFYNVSAYENQDTAVNGFSSSWQTDTLTQKIIAYPYAPFDLYYSSGKMTMPEDYAIIQGYLVSAGNKSETNVIVYTPSNEFKNKFVLFGVAPHLGLQSHSINYETKLHNSEFFTVKFVYDSFYYEWKVENLSYDKGNIELDMHVSSSMLSEFSFSFEQWSENDYRSIYDSDYPTTFIISRNNELSIYSSSYLEYMRNGYGYDLKKNALASQQSAVNVALSALRVGASIAATIASKGAATPLMVSSVISASAGLASGITSASYGEVNRQQSQAQKLKELAAQNVGVSGCTDFDISKAYTGNRVNLIVYELDEAYKNEIYNTLRLTGYASSGQYSPSLNTRALYNYLQCVPDFSTASGSAIPQTYRDLLSSKLMEGVTFFHVPPTSWGISYDFDQQYENWETLLI